MTRPAGLRAERLERVATPSGHFAILAIDHVNSFAAVVGPDDPHAIGPEQIIAAKSRLVEVLTDHAGAVLIDPAFAESASSTVADLASKGGVVLGIEDGDYADVQTKPRLLPGWDVERAAALGVDAVKISVFFDADGDSSRACRFVEDVAAQCDRSDMPLFCEPLAIMADGTADRRRHILEGVRLFSDLGIDVLKIQFPEHTGPDVMRQAWVDACVEVDAISPTPWTLLSEGKDFSLFSRLLEVACRAGASGFLGGRAVWGDAVTGRHDISESADRLDRLGAVVEQHGCRWDTRLDHSTPVEGSP
jgi:tagatose 1,6-diphosphate aldolase